MGKFIEILRPQKDTVKRVMMKDTEKKQYKNMISCTKYLITTYGFTRLFRGIFFVSMLSNLNSFEGTVSNLLRMWSSGLALALNDLLQNVIYDSLEGILNCR